MKVQAYRPHHRDQVLDLMASVQGQRTTPESLIWEFERNPSGDPNIHVALVRGEVVGVACHNQFRAHVGGHAETISFALNVVTHPDHRGRGIFTTLEEECEAAAHARGIRILLSFPNAKSEPIFLNRLEWRALPKPRIAARPMAGQLARWRDRPVGQAIPGGTVVGNQRDARLRLSLQPVERFGQWADDVEQENSTAEAYGIAKSSAHLNWRFLEEPSRRYRAYLIESSGDAIGHVVLGSTSKRGIPLSYLASLQLRPAYRSVRPSVMRAAVAEARRLPGRVCLDLRSVWAGAAGWAGGGFLPTPKQLRFIAKGAGSDPSSPWDIQLGDLDFF